MMLDIYSGETGVLRHIQDKFGALGLPREVVNQIGKFTASIDEANKYFYGTYGEEAWNLQKLDIMDKGLNSLDSVEFNMAETIDLLDTILTNTSFKKTKTIRKFEDLKQDFLANAESAARVPTDLAEGTDTYLQRLFLVVVQVRILEALKSCKRIRYRNWWYWYSWF